MTPETKKRAHEKLATFLPKIGYPDKWKDYSTLEIKRGDPVGNAKRASLWEWRSPAGAARQAGGSHRVVPDAAGDQRVLQPAEQRDRVPGGDSRAAVLRSECRRRGELRRDRRGDRARDRPWLRRSGPQVRSGRQPHGLVDGAGREGVHRAHRQAGEAVFSRSSRCRVCT